MFPGTAIERRQRIAQRIRQLGLKRVVYGSDLGDPRGAWDAVLRLIPLTTAELAIIASSLTPNLTVTREEPR